MRVWRNWLDALALEASGEIPMRVRISLPAPFKIGRHNEFKPRYPFGCTGSSPVEGTNQIGCLNT